MNHNAKSVRRAFQKTFILKKGSSYFVYLLIFFFYLQVQLHCSLTKLRKQQTLASVLAKIEAENAESNILGDINCDMIAVTPANETRHLIELCELFQYTQLIKEPTRVTSSTKSLIDLFLTNEPVKFATSGVSPIGCSDHSLIYVSRKLRCPRSIPRIIESPQYKNFVPDDFVNDMALVLWDTIEQIDNPIGAWEVW